MLSLTVAAVAAAASSIVLPAVFDAQFKRAAPGQLEAEWAAQARNAPTVPFRPFSDGYVSRALATPTNWTAKGAVTAVKNQGPHGYCGTFGRVGSAEGQFALKAGKGLVSFSEEELVDCVGWDKDQVCCGWISDGDGLHVTAPFPPPPLPCRASEPREGGFWCLLSTLCFS